MNMTPMIDVTFLLIVFFLLVNDIVANERVEMEPPEIDDPVLQTLPESRLLIVNIVPGIDPYMASRVQVGLAHEFAMDQMQSLTRMLQQRNVDANSELRVMLRADRAVAWQAVEPVLTAIANAQIRNVHLTVMLPEPPRTRCGSAG